jgi:precorrin-2/cobalt-factor-2 C20-methyltransferase
VGPGDPELLTIKGLRILQSVPVIYVPVSRPGARSFAETIVASYLDSTRQRIVELSVEMHDHAEGLASQWDAIAASVVAHLEDGSNAAYLTEGDPLLYSTFLHLTDALAVRCPDAPVVIVPGVSSINAAAAAARVGLAERDERVAILPATYEGEDLASALDAFDTVVLLKVASVFDRVLDLLEARGLSDQAVYVRRCGCPEEEIVRDVRALRGRKLDYFSLLIVRRRR